MKRGGFILLALLACSWGRADEPSQALVGILGSTNRLTIIGNERVGTEAIRQSLRSNHHFLRDSHPMAPLPDYLATLKKLVVNGYLIDGHRDVQVHVKVDETSRKVLIEVQEGPQYCWGKVTLRGLEDEVQEQVRALLQVDTDSLRTEVQRVRASVETFGRLASAESERFLKETGTLPPQWKGAHWQSPIWQEGRAVNSMAGAMEERREAIAAALGHLGYDNADFAVRLDEREVSQVALEVDVKALGPLMEMPKFRVQGSFEHTAEEILNFLELPDTFTWSTLDEVERKLWRSGRFADFCLFPTKPEGNDPGTVRLLVREMPGVPRLDAPLTKAQVAVLRAAHWLSNEHAKNSLHLHLDVENQGSVAMDMHPGRRHHFQLELPEGRGLEAWLQPPLLSVDWRSHEESGLAVLALPIDGSNAYIHVSASEDDEKPLSLLVGFKAVSASEPDKPIMDLILMPAAVLNKCCRIPDLQAHEEGELIRITSASVPLEILIDQESGRPLTFEAGLPASHVRGGTSEQAVDWSWPGWATIDGANGSIPSALALMKYVAISFSVPVAEAPEWKLVEILADGFTPVIRLFASDDDSESAAFPCWDVLGVQSEPEGVVLPDYVRRLLAVGLNQILHEVMADESWHWMLAREVHASLIGQYGHREAVLDYLAEGEMLGPVGCLAVAFLLHRESREPLTVTRFVRLGKERLEADAFRRDWEALVTQESPIRESMFRLVKLLAQADAEAFPVLTRGDAELGELLETFQEGYPRLVADGAITVEELRPFMEALWEHGLREWVELELNALHVRTPDPRQRLAKVGDWTITQGEVALYQKRQREQDPEAVGDPQEVLATLIRMESVIGKLGMVPLYHETLKQVEADPDSFAKYGATASDLARARLREKGRETLMKQIEETLASPEMDAKLRAKYENEGKELPPFEEFKPLFLKGFREHCLKDLFRDAVKDADITYYGNDLSG